MGKASSPAPIETAALPRRAPLDYLPEGRAMAFDLEHFATTS
ncbi:MAG: hypothetical protein R2722_03825 [Tessaracoccus sp.]